MVKNTTGALDTDSATANDISAENGLAAQTAVPPPSDSPIDAQISRQSAQIEALTNATLALAETVGASKMQAQRDTAFQSAMDSITNAGVALRTSAAMTAAVPGGIEQRSNCGGCSCVDPNCCTFDIYVVSIRALAMQNLEIADSVANPWSEMEIQMFAYLENGVGAVIPSLFSSIGVRKLIQYPGVPVTIERFIGQVSVPQGQSKVVKVTADALELDAGLAERLTGGRDEEGTAFGLLTLNCCSCDDQSTEFDLSFTGGGQGGGTIGIKIAARRSC